MIPTTDLEISRKLEKIIKKESLFIWAHHTFPTRVSRDMAFAQGFPFLSPAYTTDEILDALPSEVWIEKERRVLTIQKYKHTYRVGYYIDYFNLPILVSALGSLLIWCKENGYLEDGK